MEIKFYKYQGTGNDFIMIDNRNLVFNSTDLNLVKAMCDRRFGIGADGLILLEKHPTLDFQMVYFNADGNTSTMCGNGGRCLVQFAYDLGVIQNSTTFMAIDGSHDAFLKNGLVHLKMIDVEDVEINDNYYYLNTGSPHYVCYVNDVQNFPVYEEGFKIRNNDRFKSHGTNVNFIEKTEDFLWVRTYERGVEDETFSCGTGVTAAAIASSFKGMESPVAIKTLGGNLMIEFKKNASKFTDIFLVGPAVRVFEGKYALNIK